MIRILKSLQPRWVHPSVLQPSSISRIRKRSMEAPLWMSPPTRSILWPKLSIFRRSGTLGMKRRFNPTFLIHLQQKEPWRTQTVWVSDPSSSLDMPEEYRNIDPAMIERIENEIVYTGQPVTWDDIGIYLCPFHNPVAGLDYPKRCVMEMVVWPMQRPDIFTGLREVPRGMNCSRSIQKQRSEVICSSRNDQ